MVEDLIILGVGIHAIEMADLVGRINDVEPRWRLRGFIRRRADVPIEALAGRPVLGTVEALADCPDARVAFEHDFRDDTGAAPERWASLVDPSTFVASSAEIGPGCVVYPHGFLGAGAVLGRRVFALAGCAINHDCLLGDHVTLCSGVMLAGGVHVEPNCYLGQGCTIRQNVHIGAAALIGMGGVVLHDVPPACVMAGNPARLLRKKEP